MFFLKSLKLLIPLFAFALNSGCGSSDEGSENPLGDIVTAIGGADSVNELAKAYPHALSTSVFPIGISVNPTALALQGERPKVKKTNYDKIRETDKILRGEADSCFEPTLFEDRVEAGVSCYEFDSDMNPFELEGRSVGTKDGKHSNGEACLVAFSRDEIGKSTDELEKALSLVAAMICQVKQNGGDTTPPALGEEKDYTTDLESAAGDKTPITAAKMSRLDDSDGRAVYNTEISFKDPAGRETKLTLVHSPGETSDEDEGMLTLLSPARADDNKEHDPNNSAQKNRVMSIKYSGSLENGEPRMQLTLARAQILKDIEPFVSGEINYAAIPENSGNETSHAFTLTEFDINPLTNAGTFSYWNNPGGSYGEAARGFLFELEMQDDGTLKGCGVSGAATAEGGMSIRKSVVSDSESAVLSPNRYWHPRGDQNESADADPRFGATKEGAYFTEQCFIQNATTGLYEIDADKLNNADDKDVDEAKARGYSVLPGAKLRIEPPRKPRDHKIKPRNK